MCSKRRLLSNLMANNVNNADIVSGDKFYVKGNTGDFNDRQRDIFGRLSSLEEKHIEVQKETVQDEPEDKTEHEIEAQDFIVPQRPPIRRKPVPLYAKEPRRWTKYSLADVSSDQMSDKSNTSAALAFLTERKRKFEDDDEVDTADDSNASIKFTKPKSKCDESDSSKVAFRSGKWKMPEYVIGQEKKNTRTTNTGSKGLTCDKIQLGHLQDEVGSDDDDTEEKPEKSILKSRKTLRKREDEID